MTLLVIKKNGTSNSIKQQMIQITIDDANNNKTINNFVRLSM